jgi:hypothetical protein
MHARGPFLIPAAVSVVTVALAALSAAGCRDGSGTGAADGPLWILGCQKGYPYGTEAAPEPFHLNPTFFAGEPIGDITDGAPRNRLIIRMQRTGNAVENNDVLYFDIPDSVRVARCVRGRTVGGVPDWDTSTGTVNNMNGLPWCEPNGPNGLARIRLIPFGPLRASLSPQWTCFSDMHGPTAVGVTGVARDGWIEFTSFGGAEQPDLTPEMREPIDDKFQIKYGAPLIADFSVVLDDDRVLTALYKMIDVPPPAAIGGTLDGNFDFNLERGRSAQTFP